MKKKIYLAIFLILVFFANSAIAQEPCDCYYLCTDGNGDLSFPCTISGTVYPDGDSCINDPARTCSAIPVNSNSWTLILIGASVIVFGIVISRNRQKVK